VLRCSLFCWLPSPSFGILIVSLHHQTVLNKHIIKLKATRAAKAGKLSLQTNFGVDDDKENERRK
jgi:hypothetical protein